MAPVATMCPVTNQQSIINFIYIQTILQTMPILLTWLGNTDLRASESLDSEERGPILSAIKSITFHAVHLLSDYGVEKTNTYARWLTEQGAPTVVAHKIKLTSPTNYEEIFRGTVEVIDKIKSASPGSEMIFHLSPGTPAMAAIWLLLSKTRYPAKLIESSKTEGVKEVTLLPGTSATSHRGK